MKKIEVNSEKIYTGELKPTLRYYRCMKCEKIHEVGNRITSYNVCYTKLLRILNYVSEILIKKIENSNDDSKLSLLRFFKIKDIKNLDASLYNRLLALENSENFYIKEDIAKIKSNRNNWWRETMYKNLSSEDTFELFKKYSESAEYKERAEAGKILV